MPRIITLTIIALTAAILSCSGPGNRRGSEEKTPADTVAAALKAEPLFMYGIPADSFLLVHGHIRPNGFLSDILIKHGVSMQDIDNVVRNSKSVFDVRKVKSGNSYILFLDRDTDSKVRYMVYEHDPTTCYVFSFRDSLNITPFTKDIRSEIKFATGTIETSLWNAMVDNSLHPSLAVELSEVFAWTVDFFGLQKGDRFKVIYEELFIDDKSLGPGKIYAAKFWWEGTEIMAIPFIQDSTESFFDSEGNSLRKAFLKAPLTFSRISSRYSSSRMHPVLRIRRPHFGVDYAAPAGTPVVAIGDGRVVYARTESGSGRVVRIQHNSVYATAYLHLSRFGKGITAGAHVKQGDVIGYVGSTGLSTGPHLDFRFYKNGSPVDPLKVEAPPVEPIHEHNKAAFEKSKTVVSSLLETF
ncbi:MAG: M23 family metallopeptidase [Bacteroidales bacterium]|jgi:murein DD-endopeptidase MepM/ murein hydrolase activator NlpD|nr:M23 family metallopeptidase [Bacteroidales bacterium]